MLKSAQKVHSKEDAGKGGRNTLFDVDDEADRDTRMGTNLMGRPQTVAPRFTDQMRFGTTNVRDTSRETDHIVSEN